MRRRKAKKIAILPDPKFNEVVVTKFVNNLMFSGKKSLAFRIFYDAIDMVDTKMEDQEGLDVWKKAIENIDYDYDYIAHIRPTTPLRKISDLNNAIKSFINSKAVIPV